MILLRTPGNADRAYFVYDSGSPLTSTLGLASIFVDLNGESEVRTFLGGEENNLVIHNGIYAYDNRLITFSTGGGDDSILIGAADFYWSGSFYVNAGTGNDLITFGNVQGATAAGSGIDGGDGHDVIRILASNFGCAIFGNSRFFIRGGEGDDLFDLEGTQYNLLGADINVVDGGAGFDSFVWNLGFDLGHGTDQTGVDAQISPYAREIGATNIERLILNPDSPGGLVRLSASDVASITGGSDFHRALLGVGLKGNGQTLIVEADDRVAQVDLTGWTLIGTSTFEGAAGYAVYEQDGSLLVVDPDLIGSGLPSVHYHADGALGMTLRIEDLFGPVGEGATLEITDENGNSPDFVSWNTRSQHFTFMPNARETESYVVTLVESDGERTSRIVDLTLADLSFVFDPIQIAVPMVALGDINGDGLTDFVGAFQNADGSFQAWNLEDVGVSQLRALDRRHRDNRLVDFDNDGDLDLLGTTYDYSYAHPDNFAFLFENDGTGRFTEVASFSDKMIQGFGETLVTGDFNNDGLSDVFMPYYFLNEPCCGHCAEALGDPTAELCEVMGSRLMINQGGLEFSDETETWPIVNSSGSLSLKGFGPEFVFMRPEGAQALDWNDDGLIDIYVGNHFFLNVGGAFYDANDALGLPKEFDEGAAFLDWNNDGYLDLLRMLPDAGPELFQYRPDSGVFERAENIFPANLQYAFGYGISTGDLNGDGWEDIFVTGAGGTGRILLNDEGRSFSEYRSIVTDLMLSAAGPVLDDINGDGRADIIFGGGYGVLLNSSGHVVNAVYIELLGTNGERNQHGRKIQLDPDAADDSRIFTKVVDGGSGYMAQKNYTVQFNDSAPGTYAARAYMVDYANGAPVTISFAAQTGHSYSVRAAGPGQGSVVFDKTTGSIVDHIRTYEGTPLADALTVSAGGNVIVRLGAGDDIYVLFDQTNIVIETSGNGRDTVVADFSYQLGEDVSIEELRTGNDAGLAAINFTGNSSAQLIVGNAGANVLNGLGGGDTLQGLDGDDTYILSDATDIVVETAGKGRDIVVADFSYELGEDASIEELRTGNDAGLAAINFIGNSSAQLIVGNAGANVLNGLGGGDTLQGLDGDDTYILSDATDIILEAADKGRDIVVADFSYELDEDVSIEELRTGNDAGLAAINFIGNAFDQTIIGNAGANIIDGMEGIDVMIGLGGDDIYVVDRFEDQVIEAAGGGNDRIATSVSYVLSNSQEVETLSTQTHSGTEDLFLTGNQLNNVIIGNAGNNILNGVEGADTMYGLAGDDIYSIDNEGDLVIDLVGQGNDIVYTYLSHKLSNGNQIETLSTVFHQRTDAINLGGSDYDNTLIGNFGANYLNGNGGADRMIGLKGDDTYVADDALDTVEEAAGGGNDTLFTFVSYTLAAGQEVETISTAGQGATTAIDLRGNELGQLIIGNAGSNVLDGKGGSDTLYGLAGADIFAFTTSPGGAGNVDRIADFAAGVDRIALAQSVFGGLAPGALAGNAFGIGTAATTAEHRIIYDSGTGALFYDADGSGAGAAVQFAVLATNLPLSNADFFIL